MGGAIAIIVHQKMPDFWHGAVLVAPMCKVLIRKNDEFLLCVNVATLVSYSVSRERLQMR